MALNNFEISLRENGPPIVISEKDWETHNLESLCGRLAELGVVDHKQYGGIHLITPRDYVGDARLPGRRVRIRPRSEQLFRTMRELVVGLDGRELELQQATSIEPRSSELDPMAAFLSALQGLADCGIPFVYERREAVTSNIRGRLDFERTAKELSPVGIRHMAWCQVIERAAEPKLAQIVATTKELLSQVYKLPLDVDVLSDLVVRGGERQDITMALENCELLLAERDEHPNLARLFRTCAAILANERVIWDSEVPDAGGVCRFCKLNRLWEVALFNVCNSVVHDINTGSAEYHPLQRTKVKLCASGGPNIDPDIVLYEGDTPTVVIDAKYSYVSKSKPSDVYQVMSYSAKLKAKLAILVYASDSATWREEMGEAPTGTRIVAIGIGAESSAGVFVEECRRLLAT